MIKKGDILTKKPSYQLLNARFYHTTDVLDAMQEYAEEYHQSELLKLNKSDVSNRGGAIPYESLSDSFKESINSIEDNLNK